MQLTDANDFLYAWEASRTYNPGPRLERIAAPVVAINFEDDEINPPELRILDREIKRVPRGRYVLIPASDVTRGHRAFSSTPLWSNTWWSCSQSRSTREVWLARISWRD